VQNEIEVSTTGCSWVEGPTQIPPLALDEVHVWCTSTAWDATSMHELLEMLSSSEKERAARFHFSRDQLRYLACHISLRTLLARYLGLPAQTIKLENGQHGKPMLRSTEGAPSLHFNLSHAGDFCLLAFAQKHEVGVDLETLRPLADYKQIALRFFTDSEQQTLLSADQDQQLETFFRIWTCKEAFLKASGKGLQQPLKSFELRAIGHAMPEVWTSQPQSSHLAEWRLLQFSPGPGLIGALASRVLSPTIRFWQLLSPASNRRS